MTQRQPSENRCLRADGGWAHSVAVQSPEHRRAPQLSVTDQLLLQVQGGDRAAFHTFYEQLGPSIFGYLVKVLGDRAIAQDLLQEIFLTIWRRASSYDPKRASAKTWVFAIARNRVVDQRRRARVRRATPDDPHWVEETSAVEAMVGAQDAARVREALDALPESQKDVLWRSFFGFQSYTEIAADLGLALGTVKSRARLGFQKLRDLLEER